MAWDVIELHATQNATYCAIIWRSKWRFVCGAVCAHCTFRRCSSLWLCLLNL